MSELLLPLSLTLGLPLFLSGALVLLRSRSLLDWLFSALLCAGVAVYMYFAGPIWAWIGIDWKYLPLAAALVAVPWSIRRRRANSILPPAKPLPLAGTAVRCATVAVVAFLLAEVHVAGLAPAGAIDLSFPLERGRYIVLHGGGTPAFNPHRAVSAQAWAVDILALNDRGRRARGVRPEALDAYEIFDRPVVAPCDGVVSGMADGMRDQPVGRPDLVRPAGNHVLLSCTVGGTDITLLLAHFRSRSIAVSRGDRVRRGALLGRVGNSGNSTEPHLHIHAVRGRATGLGSAIAAAEAVPVTFNGRFLTRNDIVRIPDSP